MGSELENISNVIQELDNQTKELKQFSNVLKKIDGLSKNVEFLITATIRSSKEYEEIILQLEKRKIDLDNEMKDVILIAKQTNENIEKRFNNLEDNFNKKVESLSENINIDNKIEMITATLEVGNKNLNLKLEKNQQFLIDELNKLKEKNMILNSKLEENQQFLVNELSELKEQLRKKKGLIF